MIPGIDWLIQKFVIKKNAAKKAGQIFGIDVKFLEEEKEENINKKDLSRILTGEEKDSIDIEMEMDGEKLTKDDTKTIVTNSIKTTGESGAYIGGGVSFGTIITRTATTTTSEVSKGIFSSLGTTSLKVVGTGFFVVGAVAGIVVGGVTTNSYCNELLDKFENFYKQNANKIANSYIQAKKYFIQN